MISLLLIILPLLIGCELLLIKSESVKQWAFVQSLIVFGISLIPFFSFQKTADYQFVFSQPWNEAAGFSLKLGVDGISYLLVLLTTFLTPIIILSSFSHNYKNANVFYALILFMEAGLLGVFMAMDALMFYIFWELALIPIYFLAAVWGGENRIKITFKFFLYTMAGSLFMLMGLIYIYYHTSGTHSFDISEFYKATLTDESQRWLFWCFFAAFAIKMPVFPFHTWQPDTYTVSPAPATMLLSGIMLKMGVYGVIRWLLPILPFGVQAYGGIAITLAVIGIVYASFLAIIQKDAKRLVAYSSIAHVGLIAAGIFTLTSQGIEGAVVQMLSHGINVVGLFFILDVIERQTKTREIDLLGGIASKAPFFAVLFMIVMMASIALPLTNGFIGEFMLLMGVFKYSLITSVFAGLTIILGAIYMLNMYKRIMYGTTTSYTEAFVEIGINEKAVLIPLVILIFWIGLYPKTFTDIAQPAVEQLIKVINK
ncbi:MAG: NADH-quinone oxidoreductase subunit M [Bacteroidia bacterium]|nr:NADH-quinone oxidoreductase subunit M [Bacteroidia bacterium]